ncbi:hypothetical protein R1sor_020358 [Riccia sorocarpa]|uniref:Uncharacterized protein n=1 Tax=Riccia sorocarpa TaxID=122646 RepID=A0ABD3IFX2_9MARC
MSPHMKSYTEEILSILEEVGENLPVTPSTAPLDLDSMTAEELIKELIEQADPEDMDQLRAERYATLVQRRMAMEWSSPLKCSLCLESEIVDNGTSLSHEFCPQCSAALQVWLKYSFNRSTVHPQL